MSHTSEELDAMNVMSAEFSEAIKQQPFPEMPPGDLIALREARAEHLKGLRRFMPIPGPIPDQVTECQHLVTGRDGNQIKTIVYTPANPQSQPGPLIILLHEGGWIMGDLSDEEFNCRLLTRDLNATCINVEYRLAPENPWPAGINDCWDVVQYAASTASPSSPTLPANPAKGFIVGGSSAGGNLSSILAHLSRNTNLQPPITGQWLSVPYLMEPSHVPEKHKSQFRSLTTNDHDPILPLASVIPGSFLYQAVRPDADSPLFSTLAPDNYPNEKSKPAMAKAFIQVAGLDPLRDHGLIYARILEEEYGADTRVKVYEGLSHMFWTNWPRMEVSRVYASDMVDGMKWLLDL